MANYDNYLSKFSETGRPIIEKAFALTTERGQNHLSASHIIKAFSLLKPDMFNAGVGQTNLTTRQVIAQAEKDIADIPDHQSGGIKIHPSAIKCFQRAMGEARHNNRSEIDATDLLQAIDFGLQDQDLVLEPALMTAFKSIKNLFT